MKEPSLLGNHGLLKKPIIGFFSSRTTAPLSVMPTLDWAQDVAQNENAVVMSGFQSPMEREVLDILLNGKCAIILVLNRGIYRNVPEKFSHAYTERRVLFISLLTDSIRRPSVENAAARNRYIASLAHKIVLSSVTPESSLYLIAKTFPVKIAAQF